MNLTHTHFTLIVRLSGRKKDIPKKLAVRACADESPAKVREPPASKANLITTRIAARGMSSIAR
jgi:hypothetical protein